MLTSMGHRYRNRMRHPKWSYRDGTFHVAICCLDRRHHFGEIERYTFVPSSLGEAVADQWERVAAELDLRLDERQVMPNHFHGIVEMTGGVTLSEFVGRFKGKVTRAARGLSGNPRLDVWQRGFWDTRIRSQEQLERCREYIRQNIRLWTAGRDFFSRGGVFPWEWKEWMANVMRGSV